MSSKHSPNYSGKFWLVCVPSTKLIFIKSSERQTFPLGASDSFQTKDYVLYVNYVEFVVFSRLFAYFVSLRPCLCLVYYMCLHKGVSGFDAPVSCIVVRTQANTAGHLIDSQQNWPSTNCAKCDHTSTNLGGGWGNGFWTHFDYVNVVLTWL